MKWFLISDETVKAVRERLQAAEEDQDERCGASGCLCDARENYCSKYYTDGLHLLDSGLHVTDAIPADYADPEAST